MTKGDYVLLAILFICMGLLAVLMARSNVHLRSIEGRVQRVERQQDNLREDFREEYARLHREIDQLVYKVYSKEDW